MQERIIDRRRNTESERLDRLMKTLCEPFFEEVGRDLAIDPEKQKSILDEAHKIQESMVRRLLLSRIVEGVERQEANQLGIDRATLDEIRDKLLSDTTQRSPQEVVGDIVDEKQLNLLVENIASTIEKAQPFSPTQVDAITEQLRPMVRELRPYILETAKEKVELFQKEYQDHLTTGLSKKGLEHRFDIEKEKLDQRGGDDEKLLLVFFDIDGFKKINDDPNRGHEIGDEIIKEIVEKLKTGLRSVDSVGRRSGDEFMLILPGVGMNSVEKVLAKVQERVQGVSDRAGGNVTVTGGAKVIERGEDVSFDTASDQSDKAAIFEKINSPGGIRIYSEDLRPDVSDPQKREAWARKVAERDLKRQAGEIDMLLSNCEDSKERDLLEAEKELLGYEIELRVKRGMLQLVREYGPFEN